MALFQKNPEAKIATDLKAAMSKRDNLAERLRGAEAAVIERRNAAHALARDGADDKALDHAEAALRAAQDRTVTLTAALSDVRADVARLEAEVAALADQKQRAATAAEIEKITADLERAGEAFGEAARELAAAAKRANLAAPDALPLIGYAEGAAGEVPPAVAMVAEVLRHRAVLTISGEAPASLPKPEAPAAPKLAVVRPQIKTVFAMKPLAYTDADDRLHKFPKMNDCELPVDLASEAIRRKVAVEVSDPRRREMKGVFGANSPDIGSCVLLNDAPVTAAPKTGGGPSIRHSAFEEPVIGTAIVGTLPVRPVEPMPMAVGARTMPEE